MTENTKCALPGGNETILIVDDQETIWDFLIEALQNLGYSVLLAENGMDAVEIYKSNPKEIDLVLLDMVMPKLGGHKTFFQIKAIDPDAKILLSSGYVSEEEVNDLMTQGAKGFLPKPHRIKTLTMEMRRIFDEGKVIPSCNLKNSNDKKTFEN
jgi:DNA-binding NtrC family response regulator